MKTQPYYSVRVSKIHGRGVFARRPIRKGTRVIEYTGPIITTKEADLIAEKDESGHSHTMLFSIDKKHVINGEKGGDAKYINHSCSPNCETIQEGKHIYIYAIRPIKQGEELTYDYHLIVEGKITDEVRKKYACFCGSPNCRHTQISADILAEQAKKDAKKKAKKEKKRLKKAKDKAEKEAKQKAKEQAKADKKKRKKAKKDKKAEKAKMPKTKTGK